MAAPSTRHTQFENVFNNFMQENYVNTGKLFSWEMNLLTKNIRKNLHEYRVSFPETYLAYHIDRKHIRENGDTNESGAVYLPQDIPDFGEFIEIFDDYFNKYHYYKYGKNTKLVSYVTIVESDEVNKNMKIAVMYYKKIQPYPVPLSKEQELQILLDRAERRAIIAEENYNIIMEEKDEFEDMHYRCIDEYNMFIAKQSRKIIMMERSYNKIVIERFTNNPTDCPVCMEVISKETLDIPVCGHLICKDCSSKCNKCPICREHY